MLPRFIARDAFHVLYVSTTTFWVYINATGRRVCENVRVGSYTVNKLSDLHISAVALFFPLTLLMCASASHEKERS